MAKRKAGVISRTIAAVYVIREQFDITLDLLNFARSMQDFEWSRKLVERLQMFRQLSDVKRI